MRRLIEVFNYYDQTLLSEVIAMMAANVEDGLLKAGAEPGVDYTIRDVMTWTMPLVHGVFLHNEGEFAQEFRNKYRPHEERGPQPAQAGESSTAPPRARRQRKGVSEET